MVALYFPSLQPQEDSFGDVNHPGKPAAPVGLHVWRGKHGHGARTLPAGHRHVIQWSWKDDHGSLLRLLIYVGHSGQRITCLAHKWSITEVTSTLWDGTKVTCASSTRRRLRR